MQNLVGRIISSAAASKNLLRYRPFSSGLDWTGVSDWSTGITADHFDGQAVGRKVDDHNKTNGPQSAERIKQLNEENRRAKGYVSGRDVRRLEETSVLLEQVTEPGARGTHLKDSEKAEMYRLHKENPEVYTVERLAKDFRIMRQRVHAILWLREDQEKEEKRLGHKLDDSVDRIIDTYPGLFNFHDREFHVATLPYKPEFKVMPEGWDGTTKDPDEVHYEISMKEDQILYEEFLQRFKFNTLKVDKKIFCHKYSRRRPSDGWNFTVEKLGARGKRGNSGGWKFVSVADGSSRPLNEMEKMFVKRETPRRRRRILP